MLSEDLGIENQVVIRNAPSPVIRQRGRFYDAAGRDAFPKKQLKRKIKWKKHARESAKAIPLSCSAGRRPVGRKNSPLVPAPNQFIA